MRDLREVMGELVASGLSTEQHLLVLELTALVAAQSAGKDESASRRRQKDRDRKRVVRGIPQTSADSAEFQPPLEEKVSPEPPSKTQSPIPPSPPKGGSSPTVVRISKPNGFARFWEAYPSKVGKRAAELAYDRALKRVTGPDPPGTILAGVERAKPSERWRDGYIPNPATWLNQDRWLDGEVPDGEPPTPEALADREAVRAKMIEFAERRALNA